MITALLAANPDVIRFPKLGLELTVRSTAFTVFGVTVTWYGVLITIGMMLAMLYGFSRMRSFGIDSDRAIDGVIGGVIGGIVGARTYFVAFHWSDYAGDWKSILNIRGGGIAIYGGLIGALLVGSIVCKLRKLRLFPMYDVVALGFLIGQGVGRWGNFMNHEAFGGNTESIFGMTSYKIQTWIAQNYTDGSVDPDLPVHPCFFYESMWCLLGFLILHIISKKARKFDGQIFLMYVAWYGIGRFFIEGLRTDSLYLGTIKVSQLVAVVSVVTAFVLLMIGFSHVKRMGTDYQLYCETEESKQLLAESDAREAAWQEKHNKKKQAEEETESTHVLLAEDDEETDASDDAAVKKEKNAAIDALLDELVSQETATGQKKTDIDALLDEIAAEKRDTDTESSDAKTDGAE